MDRLKSTPSKAKPAEAPEKPAPAMVAVAGSQTLLRGLDVLEAVVVRPASLSDLSKQLSINRSTVHRLASALVERGYMKLVKIGRASCRERVS